MRSDPEPHDGVGFLDETHDSVIAPHANGNYWLGGVNFLEVETWVTRVANEQTVSGSGLLTYVVWKRGELLPKR